MKTLKECYDILVAAQNAFRKIETKIYLNLGKDMKKMRLKSGKSYRQTAKIIGCSAVYLCDVENGRRKPTKNLCEWYDRLFFDE